jgi:hypothetical protein
MFTHQTSTRTSTIAPGLLATVGIIAALASCDDAASEPGRDPASTLGPSSTAETTNSAASSDQTRGTSASPSSSSQDAGRPVSFETSNTEEHTGATAGHTGSDSDAGVDLPTNHVDASNPSDTAAVSPSGGSDAGDGGSTTRLLEHARADYKAWETRTTEPVHISAEIFGLCRAPSAGEDAFVESVHGRELALLDWLNEEAQAGISSFESATSEKTATPRVFPVGATIVKEKLAQGTGKYELAALGIMIKRAPGFDAANGDWQFGYWEPALGLDAEPATQIYCGECHALAGTDFVYVDDTWRQPLP